MRILFRLIVYLICCLFSFFVLATTFNPLSIEKQVEEASSGAIVEMVSSQSYKKDNGHIYTEYSFKVSEKFNLSDNDLNDGLLKLDMLGGKVGGVTSVIDGAPEFVIGKKIFILLKKINSQMYLSNFTMGKYEIQNYNGKDYFVSDVFPMNPQNGRISKLKMIELMNNKWHISEVKNHKVVNKLVSQNEVVKKNIKLIENVTKNNRTPTSEKDENPMNTGTIIIMMLSAIGIIFSLYHLKDKK